MTKPFFTKWEWDASLRLLCAAPSFQRWIGERLGDPVMRTTNVPAAIVARASRAARGERTDGR